MQKKTIGELSSEAKRDTNSYNAFDIGNEMTKDIDTHIRDCIDKHYHYFDSNEFCVVMLIAKDPTLSNMIRRKFYAWPFLPKPRTNQTVWLYNKVTDKIKMLWCLPHGDTVASLSCMITVDPAYKNMQRWSNNFFSLNFWKEIRKEHDIKMLSEEEHLELIRKKGTQFLRDDVSPIPTNPIDSMKFDTEEVSDSSIALSSQD